MFILLVFSFLAGIATVLSPCILPVLPALLSAGAEKGKYRPLGIVFGVIVSFTIFTLTAATLVQITGISASFLRQIAIVVIALFGIFMIWPRLGDWFSEKTASIAHLGSELQQQKQPRGFRFSRGNSFWSRLGTGLDALRRPYFSGYLYLYCLPCDFL